MTTSIKLTTAHTKAAEALEAAHGDRVEAAKLFRQWLDEDAQLFHELMTPLVDSAIWDAIGRVAAVWRQSLKQAVQPLPSETAPQNNTSGLEAMAQTRVRQFLDHWILPNRKLLGDATAEDLRHAMSVHLKMEIGNQISRRFLAHVLEGMGNAAIVRNALDDTRLTEMYDQAEQEAA